MHIEEELGFVYLDTHADHNAILNVLRGHYLCINEAFTWNNAKSNDGNLKYSYWVDLYERNTKLTPQAKEYLTWLLDVTKNKPYF